MNTRTTCITRIIRITCIHHEQKRPQDDDGNTDLFDKDVRQVRLLQLISLNVFFTGYMHEEHKI
jgi:hypothetical protein